jgi:DNA-binding MarR family transcriptional regulator/predicted GNAT family acetyltransferase
VSNNTNVAAVRRFNRFYTRTIGVLGGFRGSPYSLTEGRLIYELAQVPQAETLKLRTDLGLDPGYLSRILSRFDADGLVQLGRSAVDNRKQTVALTAKGREVFKMLDQHAIEDMGALLGRLDVTGQRDLLGAMSLIERLWDAPAGEAVLRAPLPGELGWVVQRHGAIYATEYGYTDEFEALVSEIVAGFVRNRDPRGDRVWIAEVDGIPAGSIFCVRKNETTAQLRLLLVESWARGLGIGGKLISACVEFARLSGYQEMVLWTNADLHAARRLYERAGFALVSEEHTEQFGGPQVFQNWQLSLTATG